MKKGCFIKSIVFLTIITAVILYIINYKFDEIIFNPGKRILINQINRQLEFTKNTPEKDSLKLMIGNYIMKMKKLKSLSNNEVEIFADSLKIALEDSVIDNKEYKSLYKILNKKVN